MNNRDLATAYHSNLGNPYQPRRKGWIADKIGRLGHLGDKPAPPTQPVGKTTSEVFKSNR